MQQIFAEETFSAPRWLKIICYVSSFVLFLLGVELLMMKDAPIEILFVVPLIFFVVLSMLMYTRLKLVISNAGIRYIGGLRKHDFSWGDITGIDMVRLGKFETPNATIYYSGRKLGLSMGFYLKPNYNRILSMLEMKVEPGLFTEEYWSIAKLIK